MDREVVERAVKALAMLNTGRGSEARSTSALQGHVMQAEEGRRGCGVRITALRRMLRS
jgi:hypothetical protein